MLKSRDITFYIDINSNLHYQMKRTVSIIIAVTCCLMALQSHAQATGPVTDTVKHAADTVKKAPTTSQYTVHPKPKGPKPITHEFSAGLRLNTDGWSVFTDLGKVKAKDLKHRDMFYNVRFWQLEFTEKKDPKEEKLTSDNASGTGSSKYIYGKINNFYALKLGYGFTKLLVGKPDPGTVSMHWVNVFGVSLGLLKPYYLNVDSDPNAIKYSDANKENFLDQRSIEGSAGFGKGLSEIKFIPGGHFKSAIHFDFSANRKNVLGVETGFDVEYYGSQVQLMADQPGTSVFLDLFIAIQFGKRW
jgi:hypothetical protein